MLSLRYHRQYLWVFYVLFLTLFCAALALDCLFPGTTTDETFKLRTPRFVNVLVVFLCAALSSFLQNSWTRRIIKPEALLGDRRKWMSKNIKVRTRRDKIKKKARKRKKVIFTLSFMFCTILNLLPLFILYGLWVGEVNGVKDAMKLSGLTSRQYFAPEFFIPAIFIKYISWYGNSICSYFYLFRQQPRRKLVIQKNFNM